MLASRATAYMSANPRWVQILFTMLFSREASVREAAQLVSLRPATQQKGRQQRLGVAGFHPGSAAAAAAPAGLHLRISGSRALT